MSSYALGLDLGSASIGWALVEPGKRVVDCGVRIFDPGVNLDDFTKGREGSSNNAARRAARLHRRQLRRRAGRQRDLFRLLQTHQFLPGPDVGHDAQCRHDILQRLDQDLRSRWLPELQQRNIPEPALIYLLRTLALDRALAPHELGRVLYHLSQRRGFKSNRKDEARSGSARPSNQKAQEELGKVKAGIAHLSATIADSGARTLGEYFLLSASSRRPIRRQWTARQMFLGEFDAIWEAQRSHHPALTSNLKEQVHKLLFFQRPIARNEHLVGLCELEPGEKRAPLCSMAAQRFRILQKVNDLEYGGLVHTQPLTCEQRSALISRLDTTGDLTFDAIRELLNLPKGIRFNLARGGEKKLPGNRTQAAMLRAIPEKWSQMPTAQRDAAVRAWHRAQSDEELIAVLTAECDLSLEQAQALTAVHPEEGYSRLSPKAMERLLPLMETGVRFKTAEERTYGSSFSGGALLDQLPPVKKALPQIPNPAVMRALTELRKVVNAIVRRYGKPAEIRIELARELKRNAEQRERDWRNMRSREAQRKAALKRILEEAHRPVPSGRDIERVLLFEECGGICPYCGNQINFQRLFDGDVDVDHILPRSKFPDNSFANKVIAHRACNDLKRGRTPFAAFSGDTPSWEQIVARVTKWKNSDKLQRFLISDDREFDPDFVDGFAARRLNDTRYVSKLAARYLGVLYGGRDVTQGDGAARRVIFASSGMLTALLRREWQLESILREPETAASSRQPGKPRTDHRHHAIDAIVTALSSNATMGRVSAASASAGFATAERAVSRIPSPWPDFVDSVRPHISNLSVSHRPTHRLNGPLHEETNYSRPRDVLVENKGKKPQRRSVVHVRKFVHALSAKQVADIVDPAVRHAVQEKVAAVGGDPKKLESDPAYLVTSSGQRVPIFRARVRMPGSALPIGEGPHQRYVSSAGNHHVPIFELRRRGKTIWDTPGVVTRHEAHRRFSAHEPLIQKSLPGEEDVQFLFSLMGGDVVEMDDQKSGRRNTFVVRTVSDSEISFVRHTDARNKADMIRSSHTRADFVMVQNIDKLREWNCRKVFVDVLGKIRN